MLLVQIFVEKLFKKSSQYVFTFFNGVFEAVKHDYGNFKTKLLSIEPVEISNTVQLLVELFEIKERLEATSDVKYTIVVVDLAHMFIIIVER